MFTENYYGDALAKTALVFFLVLLAIGIIVLSIVIPITVVNKKYRNFINTNSEALEKLDIVNKKYHFHKIANFDMAHSYDNVNFYEDISCEDYLIYQLVFKQKDVSRALKNTLENKNNYSLYIEEAKAITLGVFKSELGKFKLNKLLTMEKKMFSKKVLTPVVVFTINVKLIRTNINGERRESKNRTFKAEQIKELITKLNQKQGSFYLNRDIWDSICRVERGKVTNKMRFSIYSRDGYRCCMCGKRDRGDNLEIDHIYPIAKGGKSTYDNLQTLCHRCNQKKGANIIY